MKVATKVAAGAGLLVSLLLVGQVHDMSIVRELASVHRTMSEERFAAVTSTLDILRNLELTEETLQKLFVTRDAGYADQLDRIAATLETKLARQRQLSLPQSEQAAARALDQGWRAFRVSFAAGRAGLTAPPVGSEEVIRTDLLKQVDEVSSKAVALLSELRQGIDRDVAQSEQKVRRSERLSWALASVAVTAALLFVITIMRSLNRPLSRLMAATRTVAAGQFARLAPQGRDEISELARAFDAMVERLDELDQMKRDFVSRISHELKTPLSAMQETNQLLIEELAGPLTDKQRRMLQLNLEAGRRLSAMLSRLLDLSRLEAGAVAYDVRPVNLGDLLSTAYHEFEARLREKQITATLTLPEGPVVIDADRDWLVQVFENLLENAIKFSPPQRKLWLRLRGVTDEDQAAAPERSRLILAGRSCVVVTIADEGPGIPDEVTERIFERFFQVSRKHRSSGGVGLGLAICRDVVAAHGGTVWVTNRKEGGSTFAVALPLPTVPVLQPGTNAASEEPDLAASLPQPDAVHRV